METRGLRGQFSHAIHALVAKRQKAGATKTVEPMEEAEQSASNVVDLSALLAQSLRKKPAAKESRASAKVTSIKSARKRA